MTEITFRAMTEKDIARRDEFKKKLEKLINQYSQEIWSDTPDYILATYMLGCLQCFEGAVRERDRHKAL